MKRLVDILVENLPSWPAYIDQLWILDDGRPYASNIIYGKTEGHSVEFSGDWDIPCDYKTARVTRAERQAAVDALNAPKVVEWPDLGETVEVIKGPAEWDDEQIRMIGREGKVRSVFKNDCDQKIVAIELSSGECKCLIVECIKPARTAEQVAAEEREKAIKDMMEVTSDGISCIGQDDALALYKAGYRKEKKPCGF